jgi:hypothetical protein
MWRYEIYLMCATLACYDEAVVWRTQHDVRSAHEQV